MGRYKGYSCMGCNHLFQEESDDIVVCPDCGTPYHRKCWVQHNGCINVPLHEKGGDWQIQQNKIRKFNGGVECHNCGHVNLKAWEQCSVCGKNLQEQQQDATAQINTDTRQVTMTMSDGKQRTFNFTDPCCGMSPEEDMAGERLGDVANFVRTNTIYYIPLFKRFKETGRKISFNLPCILFPYFYFANRKMWFMTILSGLLWILSSVPTFLLNLLTLFTDKSYLVAFQEWGVPAAVIDNITMFLSTNKMLFENLQTPFFFLGVLIRILFCLFGNYLYFRFTLRSVKRIRQHASSPKMKHMLLQAEGGTNIFNILGCCGLYILFVTVVSYGIGILFR
ncbi:MAG: hypothetical protein K2H89_06460 [Oscillospiraceae bacterium]|nr:hypothetical protein [Oscillospiraceae bacterium]